MSSGICMIWGTDWVFGLLGPRKPPFRASPKMPRLSHSPFSLSFSRVLSLSSPRPYHPGTRALRFIIFPNSHLLFPSPPFPQTCFPLRSSPA